MGKWTVELYPEDWEPEIKLKPSQVWEVLKFLSENDVIEWDQEEFERDGILMVRPAGRPDE